MAHCSPLCPRHRPRGNLKCDTRFLCKLQVHQDNPTSKSKKMLRFHVFHSTRWQETKSSRIQASQCIKIQAKCHDSIAKLSIPKTLRFQKRGKGLGCDLKSRPPKNLRNFLFLKVWAPSICLCCFTGKKSSNLEFAISSRSDLRFHSATFLRFSAGPAVRVANWNLRFENAAIATFGGR